MEETNKGTNESIDQHGYLISSCSELSLVCLLSRLILPLCLRIQWPPFRLVKNCKLLIEWSTNVQVFYIWRNMIAFCKICFSDQEWLNEWRRGLEMDLLIHAMNLERLGLQKGYHIETSFRSLVSRFTRDPSNTIQIWYSQWCELPRYQLYIIIQP